jgi:hypothetical protein
MALITAWLPAAAAVGHSDALVAIEIISSSRTAISITLSLSIETVATASAIRSHRELDPREQREWIDAEPVSVRVVREPPEARESSSSSVRA